MVSGSDGSFLGKTTSTATRWPLNKSLDRKIKVNTFFDKVITDPVALKVVMEYNNPAKQTAGASTY